jgi:hypothetical protein
MKPLRLILRSLAMRQRRRSLRDQASYTICQAVVEQCPRRRSRLFRILARLAHRIEVIDRGFERGRL